MSPNSSDTTKRAPAGKQIIQMLLDGELDAVLGEKVEHPGLKPLFPDVAAEEKSWFAKHGVVPINHMVVVSETLSDNASGRRAGSFRLLQESAARAPAGTPRFSADEMRRSLELISEYTAQQGLIPRAFAVDELFDDVTRALDRNRRVTNDARTDLRSRPSRPHGIADAEARRKPEILCRRDGHDRQRPQGRVGLPARLGRLRALFAQADGVENLRAWSTWRCARAARRRWSGASRR